MYCAMNIILADYFTNPLQGAMVRASTYKLLGYIGSYSIKERVRKQIPIKYIPSKKVVPLKNTDMFEDKVWKDVRTYADVVSARIVTEQLSNKEEGINNKKY